jgi:DNA repair protein SbcD/Mre11
MPRRWILCHTADWHLGHRLYGQSRHDEHQAFLDWLLRLLVERDVKALLVAGDVFDTAHPSAEATSLFYRFLAQLAERKTTRVFVIAGNHDSPSRLLAPDPVLRALGVRMVGAARYERDAEGSRLDPSAFVHTLEGDDASSPLAQIVMVPHLRAADLQVRDDDERDPPARTAAAWGDVYRQAFEAGRARSSGEPVIFVGHCHVREAKVSEHSERKVVWSEQATLPTSQVPSGAAYVALGHLHLGQALGHEHVRYSGSPIPLSLAEVDYRHAVQLVHFEDDRVARIESVPVPRAVPFIRVPASGHADLETVLSELRTLPARPEHATPWVHAYVRVPVSAGGIRARLEDALDARAGHLLAVSIERPSDPTIGTRARELDQRSVLEVFRERWVQLHQQEPPLDVELAFEEALDEARIDLDLP